ncbi:MAG TPA: ribonucleotide-diphosphate reductase subunit beta [Actinomycetota bacterium]|nr:ribonucleotide-diphosphate reductase subunit beta [Actinomycetota bacterium]
MNSVEVAANAELKALGDIPIDDVLEAMDRPPPNYRDLYYRWERQQWESSSIDFSEDHRQWTQEIPEDLKRSLLWGLASFYVGEEQVTRSLVPFVDAAPTEEHQVFLATQLVDEARHTVFFDLFYQEVLDEEGVDMSSRLAAQVDRLNPGFRTLLLEMLPAAADAIRERPHDLDALVEGVVLYHILIEATLALTGQRFLLNFTRENGLLPGFRQGFTAVARDESRHVGFGVRFLKEMVDRDRRFLDTINHKVQEFTPIGLSVIEPPDGDLSYFDPLPYGPDDLSAFALNSLAKRLQAIGAA